MKKQFLVKAPNGKKIQVANGYQNLSFDHHSIMTDERLAKKYPDIFVPFAIGIEPKESIQTKEEQVEVSVDDMVSNHIEKHFPEQKKRGRKFGHVPSNKGKPIGKVYGESKEK